VKKQFKILNILFVAMFMTVLFASPVFAVNFTQKFARFSATCGETLATGNVATIKDADGYAYKADANDAALRPAVGVVDKGCASGGTAEIVTYGVITGYTSLTESAPGYLSETAGAITQSSPSYSQQVGYAISSTAYLINCQNYFDSSSLTVLGTLSGASPVVLEGATADAYETTIAVTDPTADRTITLPDASGVPILSSAIPQAAYGIWGGNDSLVFEGTTADAYETTVTVTDPTADRTVTLADASGTVMLSSLATNAADAANAVTGTSNGILFEGATADTYETTLTVTDPTADRTIYAPDKTGYLKVNTAPTTAATALTPGAAVALTVGTSTLFSDTVTDNEDQTITFSGAGAVGDEITIVFITAGTADEVITFHATLVSSTGTLTLGTSAGKYYVVKFISDGTHWYEVSRTAVQT
jgi:hypothetical protein